MKISLIFVTFIFSGLVCQVVSSQTYNCLANATCGCSARSATLTKIVGGESAASQTWGWAASLRRTSTNSHFCGGTIISSQHILTAAHCVYGLTSPSALRVYVGSIYLSIAVQTRDVLFIHIHPDYNSQTIVNDLAILKVLYPFNLDQAGVDMVCLPNVSSTILAQGEYPSVNTNLIAIGWGYIVEGGNALPDTLQQVTVQVVAASSSYCMSVGISDWTKQFCAGVMPTGGKDTCQGDSGGPLLMFTSDNVWQQVGITSNGVGCAEPNKPGVYTRVAAYQTWINDTMNNANHFHSIARPISIVIFLFRFFVDN